MIANLTLKQQRTIVSKAMESDGWLYKAIKEILQLEMYEFDDVLGVTHIDLSAQYDTDKMIIDRVHVVGTLFQFIDYNATVHDSKDFKGPDEVLLDYVLITLQSQLNQKHSYSLKLLRSGDSELMFNLISADEFLLKRVNYVHVQMN